MRCKHFCKNSFRSPIVRHTHTYIHHTNNFQYQSIDRSSRQRRRRRGPSQQLPQRCLTHNTVRCGAIDRKRHKTFLIMMMVFWCETWSEFVMFRVVLRFGVSWWCDLTLILIGKMCVCILRREGVKQRTRRGRWQLVDVILWNLQLRILENELRLWFMHFIMGFKEGNDERFSS